MPSTNHRHSIIPILLAIGVTIALLLTAINFEVTAQGAPTPTPVVEDWYIQSVENWDLPYFEPGTSTGNADWVTEDLEFRSNYPNGFTFSTTASSSHGEIATASIIWSHTPNQLQRLEAQINSASGEVTANWRARESLPPWIAVNYYWSFSDTEGNRFRSEWVLGNEYVHYSDEWTRVESDDVIIVIQNDLPEEVIDLTIEAMNTQHDTFIQAWGGTLSYKPRVILFSNQPDFQEWRDGFGGQAVIGQTSDDWGATVQVLTEEDPIDLAFGTVLHEIAHLYQFEFAPNGFPAGTWFTEGNATLFELHQQYDYEGRIRHIAEDEDLPLLLQGNDQFAFNSGPDDLGRYGYDVGFTFWKWIVTNYGLDAHRAIIEQLGVGASRNEALAAVLGISAFETETQWAIWLGSSSGAPTLIPTATYNFPPTSTPFQFPTQAP